LGLSLRLSSEVSAKRTQFGNAFFYQTNPIWNVFWAKTSDFAMTWFSNEANSARHFLPNEPNFEPMSLLGEDRKGTAGYPE
jgi:hypothetical protein